MVNVGFATVVTAVDAPPSRYKPPRVAAAAKGFVSIAIVFRRASASLISAIPASFAGSFPVFWWYTAANIPTPSRTRHPTTIPTTAPFVNVDVSVSTTPTASLLAFAEEGGSVVVALASIFAANVMPPSPTTFLMLASSVGMPAEKVPVVVGVPVDVLDTEADEVAAGVAAVAVVVEVVLVVGHAPSPGTQSVGPMHAFPFLFWGIIILWFLSLAFSQARVHFPCISTQSTLPGSYRMVLVVEIIAAVPVDDVFVVVNVVLVVVNVVIVTVVVAVVVVGSVARIITNTSAAVTALPSMSVTSEMEPAK